MFKENILSANSRGRTCNSIIIQSDSVCNTANLPSSLDSSLPGARSVFPFTTMLPELQGEVFQRCPPSRSLLLSLTCAAFYRSERRPLLTYREFLLDLTREGELGLLRWAGSELVPKGLERFLLDGNELVPKGLERFLLNPIPLLRPGVSDMHPLLEMAICHASVRFPNRCSFILFDSLIAGF